MLAALTIGASIAATPDPLAASLTLNTAAPVAATTPHLQIITNETDGSLLVYDGTDMVTDDPAGGRPPHQPARHPAHPLSLIHI